MKKLMYAVIAVAMTGAAGAALAQADPAVEVAPNALRTIPQDTATASSMPNDTRAISPHKSSPTCR
ncbi:MAG: hypothetical protein HC807_08095 [Gammaproteobacteria bacterium]|nr:hypothetical protein [Gammaproteobacteria bacterium]